MESCFDKVTFRLQGLLNGSFEKFGLMNVRFQQQYPSPILVLEDDSHVFQHCSPTWSSLRDTIDLCSGFGGFCQGSTASGFYTRVAVDFNDRMLELFSKQCNSEVILGDVCLLSTMVKVWDVAKGAGTLTAGFSCQPYSLLGDRKGALDCRSSCLTGVLSIAYFTGVHAVALECVSPAAENDFVKREIERFTAATGFHCIMKELCLQDIWPCRRSRAWWLLTSPMIGPVQVDPLPRSLAVSKVSHVISQILPWDKHDEVTLELSLLERQAFGADSDQYTKYLLNFEGQAPCALHAWGSQVCPCECGCRNAGLSSRRIVEKGLFGLLIQSAPDEFGTCVLRHAHPNEVMGLNGYDPVVDFGQNVRLTLAAAGQLASPLHVVWIMSHLAARLDELRFGTPCFQPVAQLTAYVTWLLCRCRQVWPVEKEQLPDEKLVSLVQFWSSIPQMSIHELVHPTNWPGLECTDVSIAAVLDHVIRAHQQNAVPATVSDDDIDVKSDHDQMDDSPTPWYDHFLASAGKYVGDSEHECVLVFCHEFSDPVRVKVEGGRTVHELLQAQVQLVGNLQIVEVCSPKGISLPYDAVIEPGQVVCIRCEDSAAHSSLPEIRSCVSVSHPVPNQTQDRDECIDSATPDIAHVVPSQTQPWSQPIEEQLVFQHETPAHLPSDVGEQRSLMNQSWISASPLLCLQGSQFLNIAPPIALNDQHLASLQNQLLLPVDRKTILSHQDEVWADDEFRYHMATLNHMHCNQQMKRAVSQVKPCLIVDPLISTSWLSGDSSSCIQWAKSNGAVKTEGVTVIGVIMIDSHWIPFVLVPQGDILHLRTWDAPQNDHAKMNQVFNTISQALGFASLRVYRLHRMFFTTNHCEALAMGFLLHSILEIMLPTSHEDAVALHQKLRSGFCMAIDGSKMVQRPWIWDAGDNEDTTLASSSHQDAEAASSVSLGFGIQGSIAHVCISHEERLDLLRAKGKMLADDEVRFHINTLITCPENVVAFRVNPVIPGFVLLEPLLLETWSTVTVGERLCESWCRLNPQIFEKGHHAVSAVWHKEHWLPIWIAPHDHHVILHTMHDEVVDDQTLMPLLHCIQRTLGFTDATIHRFPNRLEDNHMCGTHAIAFLAHVMVEHPVPDSLQDLSTLHANLKAAFVEAVLDNRCCHCPVAWGAGSGGPLIQALSAELIQHGVPPSLVDQRSQQAIKAIGSEQIQGALKETNPWRSLKRLGNNARFQFILPSELAKLVAENKGAPVSRKKDVPVTKTGPPPKIALDPAKLMIMDDSFQCLGHSVPQIGPKQIGPVASGIALLTMAEADPYLRAGTTVSTEPLAIAVFPPEGHEIRTALPHKHVTIPCKCTVNNEPLLAEALVIQIGSSFVDKKVSNPAITLEPLDVATVKILVYRDEFQGEWSEFVQSPIKHLVKIFPILRRCEDDECACDCWHNPTKLQLREPIMDVWRRQFLKQGFKPTKASDAAMFSVCLRVPSSILSLLLTASGQSGAYTEPRTPDGREVMSDYVVVWASKLSVSELLHVKQTNPVAVGLARLGDRRGLRAMSSQAAALHKVLRLESTFLPQGPKLQFVAGPFPWGSDRNAIGRALKQAGWEVKPLQPMQPIPGKGSMWLLQTIEEPPATILSTTHGEVVMSKHKSQGTSKIAKVHTVGAASTMPLCGQDNGVRGGEDPWIAHDPWKQYAPSKPAGCIPTASDGIQQLADRIQSEVLSKLPTIAPMEQDDLPDRLTTLESQVQHLMGQHKVLDQNMQDLSAQNAKQFATVQCQLTQQSQQLQGQIDGHCQSMQALMEHQMVQIRGLLAKRPRDDSTME